MKVKPNLMPVERLYELKERYSQPKLNYSTIRVMADFNEMISEIEKLKEWVKELEFIIPWQA